MNCKNPAVFYKMSTLQLFHRILQSSREDTKRDMVPFITYLLHQFFKKMQEHPLLIAETLFPKSSRACLEINVGRDVVEMEKTVVTAKKQKRLMATELQVDPDLPESEQIKVAVMALVDNDDQELVEWTLEVCGILFFFISMYSKRVQIQNENDLPFITALLTFHCSVCNIPLAAQRCGGKAAVDAVPL